MLPPKVQILIVEIFQTRPYGHLQGWFLVFYYWIGHGKSSHGYITSEGWTFCEFADFQLFLRCVWGTFEVRLRCVWGAFELRLTCVWNAFAVRLRSFWGAFEVARGLVILPYNKSKQGGCEKWRPYHSGQFITSGAYIYICIYTYIYVYIYGSVPLLRVRGNMINGPPWHKSIIGFTFCGIWKSCLTPPSPTPTIKHHQ